MYKKTVGLFLAALALGFQSANSMEYQEKKSLKDEQKNHSFKVFFIKNKFDHSLKIRLKDTNDVNMINMVHSADESLLKKPLSRENPNPTCFTLDEKQTAMVLLFSDDKAHQNIKFPLKMRVWPNEEFWPDSEDPRKGSYFGFNVEEKFDRETIFFKGARISNTHIQDTFPTLGIQSRTGLIEGYIVPEEVSAAGGAARFYDLSYNQDTGTLDYKNYTTIYKRQSNPRGQTRPIVRSVFKK